MKRAVLIFLVVAVAVAIVLGASSYASWKNNAAEREQAAVAEQQAAFDKLPPLAQTVILGIITLTGVDIIGKQLLLAVVAGIQIVVFAFVMMLFLPAVAFARASSVKYIFYMAIIFAGATCTPVALLAATLPGGKSMVTIEAALVFLLALVGMGGGFEFMYPLFELDGNMQNGSGSVKARVGGGAIRIVGRGRNYDDGKWS